jgi:DNA repair exonuclease SbcCD ATPase subunit
LFRKNPKAITLMIPRIQTDLEHQASKHALLKEKNKLQEKTQIDNAVSTTHMDALEKELQSSHDELQSAAAKYTNLSSYKQYIEKELEVRQKLTATAKTLQSLLDKKDALYGKHKEHLRRQAYNSIVEILQSELALKESTLRKNESAKELMDQTQKQIDDYKQQAGDIKLLIDALSPTDGIIAEGLFGFMSKFIEQLNSLIESIWNYPLSIKAPAACESEKLELDYKFPMTQVDKELTDVSEGSEAMLYIVDLAFRITALACYKQLGLLVLDEPFTSLDETHKINANNALNTILQDQVFEQVFMVSHNAHLHEAFKNASFIALNKMNITVPSNCNEDVKFD